MRTGRTGHGRRTAAIELPAVPRCPMLLGQDAMVVKGGTNSCSIGHTTWRAWQARTGITVAAGVAVAVSVGVAVRTGIAVRAGRAGVTVAAARIAVTVATGVAVAAGRVAIATGRVAVPAGIAVATARIAAGIAVAARIAVGAVGAGSIPSGVPGRYTGLATSTTGKGKGLRRWDGLRSHSCAMELPDTHSGRLNTDRWEPRRNRVLWHRHARCNAESHCRCRHHTAHAVTSSHICMWRCGGLGATSWRPWT